jgi:nitrogen fixation NifU-like protein
MQDLRELYQELILDHSKRPRNFGELPDANLRAKGNNPLCGDRIDIYLKLEEDVIADIRFDGAGCAISTASASMMTETLKGKTKTEVEALFDQFRDFVAGDIESSAPKALGKLTVFAGVREYPVRVKCATLAWHTVRAALDNENNKDGEAVTTE